MEEVNMFWTCLALCALLLPSVQGLYLEPSQQDPFSPNTWYFDVVEGQRTRTIDCRPLSSRDTVRWTVNGKRVGLCPNPSRSQQDQVINTCYYRHSRPLYNPVRTASYISSLTIDLSALARAKELEGTLLECQAGRDTASALINYVYPTQTSGCWVEVKRWRVEGHCNITKVYTTLSHLSYCRWYLEFDGDHQMNSTLTLSRDLNRSPYSSGTCSMENNSFPLLTSTLRYRVEMTGNVHVKPQFVGSNVIEFPRVPTVSCRPDGPHEVNSLLTCTCKTASLGRPSGHLQWTQVLKNGSIVLGPAGTYGDSDVHLGPTLLRLEDKHSFFRCDLIWAVNLTGPAFHVQLREPIDDGLLTLTVNGQHVRGNVTVEEGQTVTWVCKYRKHWPLDFATMTLTHEKRGGMGEEVEVARNTSVLMHTASDVRCDQAGRYQCRYASHREPDISIAITSSIYVRCKPRTAHLLERFLFFRGVPTSVHFDVIAYPVPHRFTFSSLGPASLEEREEEEEERDITLKGKCVPGEEVYLASCTLTVTHMTSAAQGSFDVTLWNSAGSHRFTLHVIYDEKFRTTPNSEISGTSNSEISGTGTLAPVEEEDGSDAPPPFMTIWMLVLMGVGAALVLLLVIAVTLVICRRQRGGKGERAKMAKQHDRHQNTATELHTYSKVDGEMSEIYLYPGAMSPHLHSAVLSAGAGREGAGYNYYTEAISEGPSSSHVYAEVMDYHSSYVNDPGPAPGDQRGQYDGLDVTQMAPSVYTRLRR